MKFFNTFESFLFEAKKSKKEERDGLSELDMPQRHDWVQQILDREWNKKHDNELEKAGDDKAKIKEIRQKMRKDPKFGPKLVDYEKKNRRYNKLLKNVQEYTKEGGKYYSPDGKGLKEYEKKNKKDYEEFLDLTANHMSPITLTQRPGGVLQITTQDMHVNGENIPEDITAIAWRKKIKEHIDKNGKPKGVIMDLRTNTGGSQETAKGVTDFFVDSDEYDIEKQRYSGPVRRYEKLDYKEGLEKALAMAEEKKISDYVNGLSEKEKKKYWEDCVKEGGLIYNNKRKNEVDPKYRLTGIPVVTQTSIRTFSAGEFTADTIANHNPNNVIVGHNTGGGANQTFGAYENKKDYKNAKKSSTEKAKLVADAYKYGYIDKEKGDKIHAAIMSKVESGEINDKTELQDLIKITDTVAKKEGADAHIYVSEDPDPKNKGSIFAAVPQVESSRTATDPTTKKPILKDGKPVYTEKGNWEQKGIMANKDVVAIESDPNKATMDSLEYIYKKTDQPELAKKLKENPEEFGLTKDGKDGVYDNTFDSKQSDFVRIDNDTRQIEQHKKSIETAKENEKSGISIADQIVKKEKEIRNPKADKEIKKEIKDIEDVGTTKMFAGLDDNVAKQIKDIKVTVVLPGNKKKKTRVENLMKFVPIDQNDPKDAAMIQAQRQMYNKINKARIAKKLEPMKDYEVWLQRAVELAQDNKTYQQKKKNRVMKKMKKVKESMIYFTTFDNFLNEHYNKD